MIILNISTLEFQEKPENFLIILKIIELDIE